LFVFCLFCMPNVVIHYRQCHVSHLKTDVLLLSLGLPVNYSAVIWQTLVCSGEHDLSPELLNSSTFPTICRIHRPKSCAAVTRVALLVLSHALLQSCYPSTLNRSHPTPPPARPARCCPR
jgi:hypothetical protein